MSITERIAALVERVRADEGALGKLSTGEALAAVLVLDRKDLLGDYTMLEAVERLQHGRCPFQSGAEMDVRRTRGLVLLAALSLSCAGLAWGVDHAVFASVFVALTAVAVFHAVSPRQRR
jgi:hypothetical protein